MHLFRSRQIWLAALTLGLQLSGAALLTVGLCCAPVAAPAATAMDCCKNGAAPGHICPLVKKQKGAGEQGPKFRNCCDPDLQALMALIGTAGVLVPAPVLPFDVLESPAASEIVVSAPRWIVRVESPPPRV